jgi:hypothetical protein
MNLTVKCIQTSILGITLLGTALIFFNSPVVDSNTYLFTDGPEFEKIQKKDRSKRKFARIGLALTLLSYCIQSALLFFE